MLSRQLRLPDLSDEEKATLAISRQFLIDANLTIPEFTNAISILSEKGYVWHVIFFDENLRAQIDEFLNHPEFDTVMKQLEAFNTQVFSNAVATDLETNIRSLLPKGMPVADDEFDDLKEENAQFTEVITEGLKHYKKLRPDELGWVILMPFRDVTDLYNRLGKGEKIDDIQDLGFWYDQTKYKFYIDGTTLDTSRFGEPTLVHFVIKQFFDNPSLTKIDYEDMPEFDPSKGESSYQDSMRNFVKKHPKLKNIFTVRKYNTEFHPDRY